MVGVPIYSMIRESSGVIKGSSQVTSDFFFYSISCSMKPY